MSDQEVYFVLGPTRSGKTTFCHFLTGAELSSEKKGFIYEIKTVQPAPFGKEIGQTNVAQTSEVQDFGSYLDFPGFEDTRGIDFDLRTLIQLRNKFEEFKRIHLILTIERCKIEGANGADITKITNDFIKLLGLTKKELPGITLLVTKTDGIFYKTIPDGLKGLCANSKNFIIDAIINQEIQILAFENPTNDFNLNNQLNRIKFKKQLEKTGYLCGKEFLKNINEAICKKLMILREENQRFTDIVFASDTKFQNELKSDLILCIDCDIEIDREELKINAPNIVVIIPRVGDTSKKEKLQWKIKGSNSSLTFSNEIKYVINGEKWVISFCSNPVIDFPDPRTEDFQKNLNFFRLESICINGNWTNYLSFNNIFLESIMFLKIFKLEGLRPDFKIKAITEEVLLKFYVNERLSKKETILKNYLPIRLCNNVDEYLNKCNKERDISEDYKKILEKYVCELPSMFQLFMKSKDLSDFFKTEEEKKSMFAIKEMFMEKYLTLIEETIKKQSEGKLDDPYNLKEACKYFRKFCERKMNSKSIKISSSNKELLKKLISVIEDNLNEIELMCFFMFFDNLSTSEGKLMLFDNQITGDASAYTNSQSQKYKMLQSQILRRSELTSSGPSIIKNGIILAGAISVPSIGKLLLTYFNIIGSSTTEAATVGTVDGVLTVGGAATESSLAVTYLEGALSFIASSEFLIGVGVLSVVAVSASLITSSIRSKKCPKYFKGTLIYNRN